MNARRMVLCATFAALLAAPLSGAIAQTAAADKPHKVVFQVSDADPGKWNLALNNARNVQKDLGKDKVAIEIVAYGPGIGMLKMDSVAGNRVTQALSDGVSVVACENTMNAQKLARADMLKDIGYVPAGVTTLMQRQKEGYSYIRP